MTATGTIAARFRRRTCGFAASAVRRRGRRRREQRKPRPDPAVASGASSRARGWSTPTGPSCRSAAGLAANDEQNVDADADAEPGRAPHVQDVVTTRYDRPRTNIDVSLQYYPSLSNWGRQRIQLDASAKREIWKDVFISLNVFDTYDSRPPTPSRRNDVGVVLSFGWTY